MVEHVNVGLYRVGYQQSPRDIAKVAYNDGHLYHVLMRANPDSTWEQGEVIRVPNKKGRQSVVEAGETTTDFIKRLYKGQPAHIYSDRYLQWNDGHVVENLVGQVVFIPER